MTSTPSMSHQPLLLLARTWTWLALFAALLLQSLRVALSRRRSLLAESSSPVPSHPDSSSLIPCRSTTSPIDLCHNSSGNHNSPESASQVKPQRNLCRSRSSSALEKLVIPEGLLLLSSLGALRFSLKRESASALPSLSRLRKVASSSSIFKERSFPRGRIRQRQQQIKKPAISRKSDALLREGVFRSEVEELVGEGHSADNGVPSWTASLLQSCARAKSRRWLSAAAASVPSFERQRGWDALLGSRLGMSWHHEPGLGIGLVYHPMRDHKPALHITSVGLPPPVKMWTPRERSLVKATGAEESTVAAIAIGQGSRDCCLAAMNGQISVWDLGSESYVSSVSVSPYSRMPVSALVMDLEDKVAIAGASVDGRSHVLGTWDYRSPVFKPNAFKGEGTSTIAGLKCKGSQLCIAHGHGQPLSMHDLRMMNGIPLLKVSSRSKVAKEGTMRAGEEDEAGCHWSWDEATSELADEDWDEGCSNIAELSAATPSLVSRCAAILRWLPVVAAY